MKIRFIVAIDAEAAARHAAAMPDNVLWATLADADAWARDHIRSERYRVFEVRCVEGPDGPVWSAHEPSRSTGIPVVNAGNGWAA